MTHDERVELLMERQVVLLERIARLLSEPASDERETSVRRRPVLPKDRKKRSARDA